MYTKNEKFLFELSDFYKWCEDHKKQRCNLLSSEKIGCFEVFYFFGIAVLFKQIRSNIRERWFFLKKKLFTCGHRFEIVSPIVESKVRKNRIYLNIGTIPYCDAKTGISRVSTNLAVEGINSKSEIIPVYCDIVSGGYRIANDWLRNKAEVKNKQSLGKVDDIITVCPGDWLIHTTVSLPDLEKNNEFRRKFKKSGGKEGVVLYDLIPVQFPQYVARHFAQSFTRWLMCIEHMDGIFAISESVLNDWYCWCNERGIKNVNASSFYLGANFNKKSEIIKELPPELLKYPYFVQVSTIEPRKGYVQLLQAFDLLWKQGKDVSLVIVGRYGWNMESFVHRVKQHSFYGKKLFWLEGISDDMLAAVYNKSIGVIMASEAEGFGLGIIEGLSYGKKVIVRDIPIFREVGGESLLYFQGGEPEAIANVVEKVMSNKGEVILPRLEKNISWQNSFNSFMVAFNKLNSKSV